MVVSEEWLRASARRPSDHEDSKRDRTEAEIRQVLAAGLGGWPHRVYVKGSYANNTNVRLNYDVDIAVEYTGTYHYERAFAAAGLPPERLGVVPAHDPMTQEQWRDLVHALLVVHYGNSAVQAGRIASRVRQPSATLPADVVPCWSFRRYDAPNDFHEGTTIRPRTGPDVVNYPEQHLRRGVAKNNRTQRRYKRIVRVLKRLQDHMIAEGAFRGALPSYLVECAVFNVPDTAFGGPTYLDDTRSVIAALFNDTLPGGRADRYEHVNGLMWLFAGANRFDASDVHRLANAAWDYLRLT